MIIFVPPSIPVEFFCYSQSPTRPQAAAARILHPARNEIAAAVLDFKHRLNIETPAPPVFHFNNHAVEKALAPGVVHLSRCDPAPMFIHPWDLVSGKARASYKPRPSLMPSA
jgi:hypothetical protein